LTDCVKLWSGAEQRCVPTALDPAAFRLVLDALSATAR